MSHRHPEHLDKYYADTATEPTPQSGQPPLEPCVGCGRTTRGRREVFEYEVPACSDQCAKAATGSVMTALGSRMGSPH